MKARIPGAQQGGSANMMKKIQEMQEEMSRVQQEVEETEFTASAGGGQSTDATRLFPSKWLPR